MSSALGRRCRALLFDLRPTAGEASCSSSAPSGELPGGPAADLLDERLSSARTPSLNTPWYTGLGRRGIAMRAQRDRPALSPLPCQRPPSTFSDPAGGTLGGPGRRSVEAHQTPPSFLPCGHGARPSQASMAQPKRLPQRFGLGTRAAAAPGSVARGVPAHLPAGPLASLRTVAMTPGTPGQNSQSEQGPQRSGLKLPSLLEQIRDTSREFSAVVADVRAVWPELSGSGKTAAVEAVAERASHGGGFHTDELGIVLTAVASSAPASPSGGAGHLEHFAADPGTVLRLLAAAERSPTLPPDVSLSTSPGTMHSIVKSLTSIVRAWEKDGGTVLGSRQRAALLQTSGALLSEALQHMQNLSFKGAAVFDVLPFLAALGTPLTEKQVRRPPPSRVTSYPIAPLPPFDGETHAFSLCRLRCLRSLSFGSISPSSQRPWVR